MRRFDELAREDDADDGGIDISPLIDVVFILLIFFIVTTTFVEEPGVEVDRPQAATAEQLSKNSILLAVTPDGGVIYSGRDIGLAGVEPLIKRLIEQEQLPVIIQGDAAAHAGLVVRVVGEAKLAGASEVRLATRAGAG